MPNSIKGLILLGSSITLLIIFQFWSHITSLEIKQEVIESNTLQNLKMSIESKRIPCTQGIKTNVPVRLHNIDEAVTYKFSNSNHQHPINLSYHLIKDQKVFLFDGLRSPLNLDLAPKQGTIVYAIVQCPEEIGPYEIEFDLVQEGITWFSQIEFQTVKVKLEVNSLNLTSRVKALYFQNSDLMGTIEKKALEVLIKNKCEFMVSPGIKITGFCAGTAYPQIWIRDTYYISQIHSKYFSSDTIDLKPLLEFFLIKQNDDGSVPDWISSSGTSGKNTVSSDQEAYLILTAALIVLDSDNKDWLNHEVNGMPIIKRLNNTIEFIFTNKLSSKKSCITRGHTADWGDVSHEFSDHQAAKIHPNSIKTCGIYDQSLYIKALDALITLNTKANTSPLTIFKFKTYRNTLINFVQEHLWQPQKGFFRIHTHLSTLEHPFNEDETYAMVGNLMAIEAGILSEKLAKRSISTLLKLKSMYNCTTISTTLYPAYPDNFFKHPILQKKGSYQNGGQWDWLGAYLLPTLTKYIGLDQTKELLLEILNQEQIGEFYEWRACSGTPGGSPHYSGGAASILHAMHHLFKD
jgi:hypothetical protein